MKKKTRWIMYLCLIMILTVGKVSFVKADVYQGETLPMSVSKLVDMASRKTGGQYFVIFYEGFRDGRLEMSSFSATKNFKVIWDYGIDTTFCDGDVKQYHYNNGEFVLDRYYDRLTDYATGIVASNVDIYDASGRIVFKNNLGIKNINKAAVSGLKPQYTYTGKGITPSVTVSVDGITLKKDTDYSLSYKNNKNVGTATISIKGKGKYTGTKNLTFTIVKIILQNQTIKVNSSFLKSYSANGTFKLNATAKGKLSYKSSNTKVVTVSSKGVVTIKGTGNAVITVKAGKVLNKYNAASKNVKIKIVLKNKNMYVQPYKGVSLKSKASLTGKKVTAIPYAVAVEVKSYSNGWAYVTYKGKKGYIQEKNLGDVKPVPASSDKLLTQYSNQMSYRLVDFTKKFSKNAYRSNVTATSTEQLKKLGNMINVYASSQIIEKDKKEILEAFADAVLQAILNSNIRNESEKNA